MTEHPHKISSLHDDLLWPKVAHECGLGEFRGDGTTARAAEKSRLGRTAQFAVDHIPFDHDTMSRRGEGYDQYAGAFGDSLRQHYETVVAAIFDRYTLPGQLGPDGNPPSDAEMDLSVTEAVGHHDHFGLARVRSSADITSEGPNFVVAIEGLDFVRNLDQIDTLLAGGVRILALQYNRANALADSESGLTDLGRRIVDRLSAAKAIIDLAHSPPRTRSDVLDMAEADGFAHRITYTHGSSLPDAVPESAARSPDRYLAPAEIVRIIASGGIIGLTPTRPFFVSLERFAERIDAICQVANGPDAVALGTDFGGVHGGMLFPEIQSVTDLWRIGDVLADRHGFGDGQIARVLRSNVTGWIRRALI